MLKGGLLGDYGKRMDDTLGEIITIGHARSKECDNLSIFSSSCHKSALSFVCKDLLSFPLHMQNRASASLGWRYEFR
jgi:hypothetical protein